MSRIVAQQKAESRKQKAEGREQENELNRRGCRLLPTVYSLGCYTRVVLIDTYAPTSDESESHQIEIKDGADSVYRHLWSADLGGSIVIKALMGLRTLPGLLLDPTSLLSKRRDWSRRITLQSMIDGGFGQLAETPGEEVVLGIVGRFWRPTGNVSPFDAANFHGAVPSGLARGVWNFHVRLVGPGRTILTTETRVLCSDAASRSKFRAYWLVVRPFSGLIRHLMLRAVKRDCER